MSEKKEILIVEHEEILLKLQSLLLTSRGYIVKGVSTSKMALAFLTGKKPDLVVLDMDQEEVDAFEVCRQIKNGKDTGNIPVIIISARQSSEEMTRGEQAGADCLITKPFKASLLVNTVFRLISGNIEPKICFSRI